MNSTLYDVPVIDLFTGTNGREGCTCKCLGCYLGGYKPKKPFYQGNMFQISELASLLPNLKHLVIFGNPDISVDPEFCNEVARFFQERNVKLHFSTSGIGGSKVIETVLNNINPLNVNDVIFSVDSINNNLLSKLKGADISREKIVEGIKCCNRLGIRTRVMPVIWSLNMDEDWIAFKNYFDSYGVSKIIVNFGGVGGAEGRINHVPEDKIIEVRNKCRKAGFLVPYGLVTDTEYKDYLIDCKTRCGFGNVGLTVYLEEDGIKASLRCPPLTGVYPEYIMDIRNVELPIFPNLHECPVAEKTLGYSCKKLRPVCRYYRNFYEYEKRLSFMKQNKKMIIVFEGIDAAGKTTQAIKLHDFLNRNAIPCRLFTGKIDEKIFKIAGIIESSCKMEKSKYIALRFYEISKIFYDFITKNTDPEILIFDRYIYSYKLIHQNPPEANLFIDWLPTPNILFYFDIEPNIAMQRINERGEQCQSHETIEALNFFAQKFPEMFKNKNFDVYWVNAIDAIDSIHQYIYERVQKIIKCYKWQ